VGLTYTDVRQLLVMQREGASFTRVLTVGRLSLFLHRGEIVALRKEFGVDRALEGVTFGGYADPFLREALQIESLDSLDASSYEGATVVHDLNVPIDERLHEQYDVVIDGGSLEHVFNITTALANVMKLVRVGGQLLLVNPANNLCGHGFYQLSPELAFSVFRDEHGFELRRVALVEARFPNVEASAGRLVLDVRDPREVGRRVLRLSCRPGSLMVQARKTRHLADPFAVTPQQSDYVAHWQSGRPPLLDASRRPPWLARGAAYLVAVRELALASRYNRRVYARSR